MTPEGEAKENRDRLPNADDFLQLQETVRELDAAGAWGSDLVRDAVLRLFVMPSVREDTVGRPPVSDGAGEVP
jgi:hypothetical protein